MKIGAIGIRTKIIVGDAATWHLVKKYIDGKIIDLATDYETLNNKPKINDVELSGNKTSEDLGLVYAVEGKSLVDDLEIEKLAGIEENANDYTHPETHPSSILDVVDVVDGAANKFLNERGEMVAVAHESLTDKNKEAAFQHVDTTITKPALDAADMVAVKDSETGKMVLTPKSNFNADNLIAEYTYNENKEVVVESIDYATYTFTSTAHGLVNGDVIVPALNLNNALYARDVMPINVLQVATTFKVAEATANTFKITKADVVVQPVSHATVDFTKWHFERTPTTFTSISITNLPITLKRCRVEVTQYSAAMCYYRCMPFALTYLTAKGMTNQADVASCLNVAYYEVIIDIIDKKVIYRGNFYRQRLAASSYDSQVLNFAGRVPSSSLTYIPDITLQFGYAAGAINGTSIKIYKL